MELAAKAEPAWRPARLSGRLRRQPAGTPAHPVCAQFPASQRCVDAAL